MSGGFHRETAVHTMHTTPDSNPTPEERTVVETTAAQALTGHTVGGTRAQHACLHCERPLREGDPVHAIACRSQRPHRFEAAVIGCQQCPCGPMTGLSTRVIYADAVLALVSRPQLSLHQYCLREVSITHYETRSAEETSARSEQA